MPPLVAAIAPIAGLLGGTGFGSILANALIGTAINFAVGAVVDFITPDEPANDNALSGVELAFRAGANVPISALMGIKDTAGQFSYHNSYGNDNEFLQLLFIDGNAEHDAMVGYLVDNNGTGLEGSNSDPRGFVITRYKVNGDGAEDAAGTPHAWVKYYTGAAGQTADPELVARARPAGRWTAACTMTATAYRVVTLKYNPTLFGGAIPAMRALWRGLKLYDRRKDSTQPGGSGPHRWGQPSTYEWTENVAICQDNWRRGIWVNGVKLLGLGVSEHDCYHAGIVSAANVCAENVTYVDTGRVLPRYNIGVEIKDGSDPISMMRLFEGAMGGYGADYGGAYTPLPAQTMVSVMTLTDRQRVGGEDVLEQTRMSPLETKTAFHGKFLNPDIGWLPDDYVIRFDAVAEGQEEGRRLEAFDASFTSYRETASMLAEIKVRRDRYSALEVATFGPRAESLKPGQVITRDSAMLGTIPMMVLGVQRQPGKKYRLSLRSWNNAIVPSPTGGFMPLPVTPLPAPIPVRLTKPAAFLAVAISQVSGPNKVPAIRVTWTPITDGSVDRVIVKYWPSANPTDARYASSDDPGVGIMVIEGVAPATEYQLLATIATTPFRVTSWTDVKTVVTGAMELPISVAEYDALAEDVEERVAGLTSWAIFNTRETIEEKRKAIKLNVLGAVGDFNDRQLIRRQYVSETLFAKATFTEQILLATGPTSALAQRDTDIEAKVDGNLTAVNQSILAATGPTSSLAISIEELRGEVFDPTTGLPATNEIVSLLSAEINDPGTGLEAVNNSILSLASTFGQSSANGLLKVQTVATASGATATAALGVTASSGGTMGNAALYLNALSDGSSEVFVVANRFAVKSSPTGTKYGLFAVDAGVVWIDEARIRNLTAANITAGSISADRLVASSITSAYINVTELLASSAFIANLHVTNASIDDLTVTRIKIADGAIHDFPSTSGAEGPISNGITKSYYGANFNAPPGPFLIGVSISVAKDSSSAGTCAVGLQDMVTSGLIQLASGSDGASYAGVAGPLISGRAYRFYFTAQVNKAGGGPDWTVTGYSGAATIPRK